MFTRGGTGCFLGGARKFIKREYFISLSADDSDDCKNTLFALTSDVAWRRGARGTETGGGGGGGGQGVSLRLRGPISELFLMSSPTPTCRFAVPRPELSLLPSTGAFFKISLSLKGSTILAECSSLLLLLLVSYPSSHFYFFFFPLYCYNLLLPLLLLCSSTSTILFFSY